jgi:hypothetical protein
MGGSDGVGDRFTDAVMSGLRSRAGESVLCVTGGKRGGKHAANLSLKVSLRP